MWKVVQKVLGVVRKIKKTVQELEKAVQDHILEAWVLIKLIYKKREKERNSWKVVQKVQRAVRKTSKTVQTYEKTVQAHFLENTTKRDPSKKRSNIPPNTSRVF